MYYKAIVKEVIDELYIRIEINNLALWCFSNIGYNGSIGDEISCELELFGDLTFHEVNSKPELHLRKGISYDIFGVFDFDRGILISIINFKIDDFFLSTFSYLDGKMVSCNVNRINIRID